MKSTSPLFRYAPWPVPACFGVLCGAVTVFSGPAAGGAALLACVLLALLQPRPREALLFLVLGFGIGCARSAHWQARPDPLAGLPPGEELVFEGHSDGQVVETTVPARLRLWLSPQGSVPPGRVVLRGEARPAEGARNPGGFDFRGHLHRRGIAGQLHVRELLEHETAGTVRARLLQGLTAGLPERPAALLAALSLGERAELGDLRELFQKAGLAHVLALSGLHLSVLAGAAARLLGGRRGWRRPLLLVLTAAFTAVAGVTPSLLRAAFMTGAWLLVEAAGRGRADGRTVLCLAAFVSLTWRPAWLYDLSFQLSYLALAGLLAAAPGLARRVRGLPVVSVRRVLLTGIGASLAAQLPALSVTAGTFNSVPLFGTVANLVAVPLASVLVPLALLAAVTGAVALPLAVPFKLLAAPLSGLLIRSAELGARLPQLPWGSIGAAGHLYWGVACLGLFLLFSGAFRPLAGMAVISGALLASLLTPHPQPDAELLAFDVGQGDAFLLRIRGGANVLIDAGGTARGDYDPGERVVVPALRALGVHRLDLVVSTHADADHAGGLPAVLDSVPVQLLAIGTEEPDRPVYRRLLEAAARNRVPVTRVLRGERLQLAGLGLEVLNPGPAGTGIANEDSVALNVWLDGRPVAVMPAEVSADLEALLPFAPAPVLTVPHHGSRFSSSPDLLRKVAGHTAVISVGRNNYGHPHEDVLARLTEHGYRIRTTLEEGAVHVPLTGNGAGTAW